MTTEFVDATVADIDAALQASWQAFQEYKKRTLKERAWKVTDKKQLRTSTMYEKKIQPKMCMRPPEMLWAIENCLA